MKKIHMIAALLAMLMPTVLWAGGSSTTYYAALKAQVSSNSSGMGKVYAGTSNSAPSASSYNASSSQTSAQESETQNSTKDLYAFALPNDGYEFVGWSRSNNGTDLGKGTAVGDAYRITAKVTFNSESSPNAQTWYATFKEKVLDAFSITFATSAGILTETACGKTTYHSVCTLPSPRLYALSNCIVSTASIPLRKASAM